MFSWQALRPYAPFLFSWTAARIFAQKCKRLAYGRFQQLPYCWLHSLIAWFSVQVRFFFIIIFHIFTHALCCNRGVSSAYILPTIVSNGFIFILDRCGLSRACLRGFGYFKWWHTCLAAETPSNANWIIEFSFKQIVREIKKKLKNIKRNVQCM